MSRPIRILGISGSLRRESHNSRLLAVAAERLPSDVIYRRFEALKAIPPFDEEDEHDPGDAVEDWRAQIRWADGLIIATPEYNASIPGQLKNAVDWASRPFATAALRGTCAAVVGASTSMFGAVWAQAHLRAALGAAGARVIDQELAVPEVAEQVSADGLVLGAEQLDQLDKILDGLLRQIAVDLEEVHVQ